MSTFKLSYFAIFLLAFQLTACVEDPIMDPNMDPQVCVSDLDIELIESQSATCNSEAGSLEFLQIPNVSYSLDGLDFTESGKFENLTPGIYKVTLKDEEDCITSAEFNVFSTVSLLNDVIPLFGNSCALSGCHVTGAVEPSFQTKANIISFANQIRSQVVSKIMPPQSSTGPLLTDSQIATIACWVDDGAKDN